MLVARVLEEFVIVVPIERAEEFNTQDRINRHDQKQHLRCISTRG
jgi:hypothetical protein